MKFRAVIQDPLHMREFQNIFSTLSKLTRDACIMKACPDRVNFIANEDSGSMSPFVCVDIDVKQYFPEYIMEGANSEYPNIFLAFSAASLGRALISLRQNARSCKIKLNKIQFPCLTIEVEVLVQNSAQTRNITHDVPVSVIPRCDWPSYALPMNPPAQLVVSVRSIRLLRNLIDKIRNIAPNIVFHVSSNGELNLVAEAEMATLTTRFKELPMRAINPRPDERQKELLEASCPVDCRKTSILFNALQLPTEEVSCGIDDMHCIHFEIIIREGVVFHSIIPSVVVI